MSENIVGRNIRKKRLENDMEQQELARRAGVNKSLLCGVELGKRRITIDDLSKVADVLECSVDELLGRKIS